MSPSNIWNERSSAQQIFAKHRPFKIIASSLRIMCNVLFWKYLSTTTPSSSPRSAPSRLSFHSFLSHQVQIVLSTVLDVWPSAGKWSTHQGLFKKKKRQDITWHDMAWAGCMRMVMQGSKVSCHLQKLARRCNRKKNGVWSRRRQTGVRYKEPVRMWWVWKLKIQCDDSTEHRAERSMEIREGKAGTARSLGEQW